jgi:dihydrofolate reductase
MRTKVFIGTSLDGFIARKNGDIEWLVKFAIPEVNSGYEEFIKSIDAVVIGRRTFETVLTFPSWPYQQKVFVLSTTMKQVPDKLKGKAAVLSMKPRELLTHLSNEGFSNVYVDGGKVIQDFLREDCIEELIIARTPALLGSGIPLFGYIESDLKFRHLRTHVYSNGLVRSYYERDRE